MTTAPEDFDPLWDYDHPAETEGKLRVLLPEAKGWADRQRFVELMTQIARAEGLQRKFADAAQTLDAAETCLTADMPRARVRLLLERGRIAKDSGHPAAALTAFRQAWDEARTSKEDAYAVDAAHMIAIVEAGESRLSWNRTALQLALSSKSADAGRWVGSLYNNLGWTYHDSGDCENALDMFRKAIGWHRQRGQMDRMRTARWSVARVLRSQGRYADALLSQRQILKECEAAQAPDAYVREEIAECLYALGQQDEARPYFGEAYELLAQDRRMIETEPERIMRLKRLAG